MLKRRGEVSGGVKEHGREKAEEIWVTEIRGSPFKVRASRASEPRKDKEALKDVLELVLLSLTAVARQWRKGTPSRLPDELRLLHFFPNASS